MLDFTEIALRIENPALIKAEDLGGLLQLAEKHPFTPIFPQLYLKGLAIHNIILFDSELQKYAYKIPDRVQLYHLVNAVPEELKDNQDFIQKPKEEKIKNKDEDESNVEIESNSEKSLPEEESVSQTEEENTIVTLEQEKPETNSKKEKKNIDNLEQEIIAYAISSSISLEVDTETDPKDNYNFKLSKRVKETRENEKKISEEESYSPLHIEQKEIEGKELKTFTSWLNMVLKEKKEEITTVKTRKASIREKNKGNLTIERRTSEFFSPTQKATESLDETRLPVSETLAKIYEMQGNYPKAIESYEKLILKNPKKKSFFALRIQSLKKKLN